MKWEEVVKGSVRSVYEVRRGRRTMKPETCKGRKIKRYNWLISHRGAENARKKTGPLTRGKNVAKPSQMKWGILTPYLSRRIAR
jgi:hypothetical protein